MQTLRRPDGLPLLQERVPLNDNNRADGICPRCHIRAPVVPIASQRVGAHRLYQHWMCDSCGHEWTTSAHVSS